jgi:nucleoside-diphosphate-sugar epimerase
MAILVTGAGLVGTAFAQAALARGESLVFLDPEPRREFLARKLGPSGWQLAAGDVRNLPDLIDTIASHGIDRVVHTAGVIGSRVDQALYTGLTLNLVGTLNVAEAVRLAGVKRLVHVSTLGVYDWRRQMAAPVAEDFPRGAGRGYGNSKAAQELLLEAYQRRYGFELIMIRPGQIFGLGHFWAGSGGGEKMQDLMEAAVTGAPIRLKPADMGANEYIYAKDVGAALDRAVSAVMPAESVFNIGSGRLISLGEILNTLKRLVPGLAIEIEPGTPAAGQAQPMDTSRAKTLLGWQPRFTLEAALADYLAEAAAVGADARRKLRA